MPVYLDHNASTTVRPSVIALMSDVLAENGNPSSVHAHGQAARARVETARRQVGKALCARPEDVIFTGCGTEALNLAITSAITAGGVERLLVSSIEHEAVAETARASGLTVEEIPVDATGIVKLDLLAEALSRPGKVLAGLMLANNEIGTIQPVTEAGALVREAGGLFLVDAIQAAGKIPVDFAAIGADYMAISAHKFGGPQGVGALLAACNAPMSRHNHGGGQEMGRRAGTLNAAGIAGLGLALEEAVAELDSFAGLADWRDEMQAAIKKAAPNVQVLGEGAPCLPNTLALAVPGWRGETQVMALDLENISISAGSACSSGKAKASKMGTALDLPDDRSDGVVRISLGWSSNRADVDALITAWTEAYERASKSMKVSA